MGFKINYIKSKFAISLSFFTQLVSIQAIANKHSGDTKPIKDAINSCAMAKDLVNKAKAAIGKQKITLNIVPAATLSHTAGGAGYYNKGVIEIADNLSFPKQLHIAVFELANLSHAKKKQDKLFAEAFAGRLTKDEFTYLSEKNEFRSVQITDDVVSACQSTSNWDKNIQGFGSKNFKELLAVQEKMGHTDRYRKKFDQIRAMKSELREIAEKAQGHVSEEELLEIYKKEILRSTNT